VDSGVCAGTPEGETLMMNLLEHVKLRAPAALEEVDSSEDLTDSTGEAIEDAIKSYFSQYQLQKLRLERD
jgi:hypothetical protein